MRSYAVIITQIIMLIFSSAVLGAGRGKSEAKKQVADKVVVTVNGVRIMQSELSKEISIQLREMMTPEGGLTNEMRFEMRRPVLGLICVKTATSGNRCS